MGKKRQYTKEVMDNAIKFVTKAKQKTKKKQEEDAAKENTCREKKKGNYVPKKKPKKILAAKDSKIKMNIMEIVDTQNVSPMIKIPKKHLAVVCCDACLNPIIKRTIQCRQCNQQFHQTVSHPFTENIFLKMMKIRFYVINVYTAVILIHLRVMNCLKLYLKSPENKAF
ncbi:unnamed protein product [Euphydryas editha]|uniref:Recombination activating protein 1 n=1 Tax=Euphydryas editha TaxID=104508 RepID=A0AAU9TP21_EUPED|nr:unnamed protein product [Euphydryas editha]